MVTWPSSRAAVVLLGLGGLALSALAAPDPAQSPPAPHPPIELFFQGATTDGDTAEAALDQIGAAWRAGYAAIIIDMARLMRPARPSSVDTSGSPDLISDSPDVRAPGAAPDARPTAPDPPVRHPSSIVRRRLIAFLERQTGQRLGDDLQRWRRWMWNLPYDPHPDYAVFKDRSARDAARLERRPAAGGNRVSLP